MEKKIEDYLHFYLGNNVMITGIDKGLFSQEVVDSGFYGKINSVIKLTRFKLGMMKCDSEDGGVYTFKPILRKLSDISEQDACDVAKILISPHAVYHITNPEWCLKNVRYWARCGLVAVFNSNAYISMEAFNYLRSKGYDCDDLIESNLAFDINTLN